MGRPRVQLVSSPDVDATVLYDFNIDDNTRRTAHAGFDLGAPEWRGEPGSTGGTDGYRSIRFTHWMSADRSVAQSALATLGRLLLADNGWLLIQLDPAVPPVWARTWRSSPNGLSWEDVYVDAAPGGRYGINIQLTADPFLVGEQMTAAPAVFVANDPSALSTTNIISDNDSSFETDVSGWSATGTNAPTKEQDGTRSTVGTKSMRVTWAGGTTGSVNWHSGAVLTVGTTYRMSAQVWVPSGSPDVRIGSSINGVGRSTGKDAWETISYTFQAAGTSTGIYITPTPASATGIVYIDNVQLVSVSNIVPLDPILGDAPAPVIINADPGSAFPGYRWMFSMHSGETTRAPVVWQVGTSDGWTVGTDTAAATANGGYSGGSYRAVSFATDEDLVQRLSGAAPAALAPGRYKVLCRLARSDTSSTFGVAFGVGFTLESGGSVQYKLGDTVQMDRSTSVNNSHATYVELGDFQFPVGVSPVDAVNGTDATPNVALYVSRTSGTGSANLDCIVLIPIEMSDTSNTTTLVEEFIGTSAEAVTWDGETERVWGLDGSGVAVNLIHRTQGSFLYAAPGTTNVMTLFRQVNGQHPQTLYYGSYQGTAVDGSDSISASTTVTITYRPRWIWPRP